MSIKATYTRQDGKNVNGVEWYTRRDVAMLLGVTVDTLEARGILVRYFGEASLVDTLRITVGTDEEQTALLESLGTILNGESAATG